MKHIGSISKFPVAASETSDGVDIGGIISGAGKAIGSIIFATALGSAVKTAAGFLETLVPDDTTR
ncbi:MAG TPA: hypothetical protein PKO36_09865 [Candidatus Hydrogenedentes bacterium]|nr:hypothetical protein [Candidatus Hydrogenedentota bacterium]HOT51220.1 hypothetical protein [Candidatus Hydrogenedentota bacterium]HOV74260.1 hypothetical protein [Candidatus Hydrogenedentota bacterium]HPC15046.1 hypothetical protein [Candidatus Hydrogenedentota bacterium]HRT19093.1 hypothetical protein [Candidatus Hydrogenedentota bacterium]